MAGQLPGGAGRHRRPGPLPGHPEAHGAQEELFSPGMLMPRDPSSVVILTRSKAGLVRDHTQVLKLNYQLINLV